MSVAKNGLLTKRTPPLGILYPSGKVLHMDRHQALVLWNHLILVLWRGEVDKAAVQRLEDAGMEVLRRYPGGAALMGVIESTAVPPSGEMRKASAAANDRLARRGLVGIAGVVCHTGFAGSVMRGVITGVTLLSRSECPFKVFDNHGDGAAWLSKRLSGCGEQMGALQCSNVVAEYRGRYADHWQRSYQRPTA